MFDLQTPPDPAQEPPVAALQAPSWDLTVGLIAATVQLDQRNGEEPTRRVGTGFLINAPRPNLLRFMPALNVTDGEIDEMLSLLRRAIG